MVSGGCLGFGNNDVPDLMLANERDQESTITTVVTRLSDDQEILDQTTTIPEDGYHEYEDPIGSEGTHRIRASLADGFENQHEWDAPSDEAYGIQITINEDDIEFTEVVA